MGDYVPSTDRPERLDMVARLDDVRRMALSHHALVGRCRAAGWDDEDLVQEVVLRVTARQRMASRYDPKRAGLGKYLHTITRTILQNLADCRRFTGTEVLSADGDLDHHPDPHPDPEEAMRRTVTVTEPAPPTFTSSDPPEPDDTVEASVASVVVVTPDGRRVELGQLRLSVPAAALGAVGRWLGAL